MDQALLDLTARARAEAEKWGSTPSAPGFARLVQGLEAAGIRTGEEARGWAQIRKEEKAREQADALAREREKQRRAAPGVEAGEAVETIGYGGKSIRLGDHVVRDAVTIFDFYADWCGPCRRLSPTLERLANETPGVYLRKIDIKDWNSPVAAQYRLQAIPSVWIYGKDGKLAAERLGGEADVTAAVRKALAR